MYKITLINGNNETVIHHYSNAPNIPKLISASCKFGLNAIPSLTITIPYVNPGFNSLYYFLTHIKIEDEKDNEIFYGRLITPDSQMQSDSIYKQCVFEGQLGYLQDTEIRPHEWHDTTVKQFITDVLNEHNSQVEDYKKIYVGNVEIQSNLYRLADYDTTWDLLIDRLPNKLGGFLHLRKVNGKLFLDYLQTIGTVSKQEIIFGENLLDFQETYDPSGIFTRLIPLGADQEHSSDSQVGNKLTIESVNNGIDYIQDDDAIKRYGIITRKNPWDDVTEADNLLSKAKEYLKENSKPLRSLSMTIADMHEINPELYDRYNLGDEIPIKCEPLEVDENYKIIEIDMDLIQPSQTKYTFGNKIGKLTDQQIIMQNSQEKIDGYFNQAGLNVNYLNGTINLLRNSMGAMVDKAEKHKELAILFECKVPGDFFGAMAIGTKGFMISDELEDDGKTWKWKTFGTAKGFTADLITAGILKAVSILSNDETFMLNMEDGVMSTTGYVLGESNTLKIGKGVIECNSILRIRNIREDTENSSYLLFSHNNSGKSYVGISSDEISLSSYDGGDINLLGSVTANSLKVTGDKNCLQETKNYKEVPFYSIEDINSLLTITPIEEIYKTELNEKTGNYCRIINFNDLNGYLPNYLLQECLSLEGTDYNIYIDKMSFGDYYIKKYSGYFIVFSDREMEFKYTLMARRKGFEDRDINKHIKNLEEVNENESIVH